MDELHLTLVAPSGLAKAEYAAMVRTLSSKRFAVRLHKAVQEVLQHYPSLRKSQARISR
jgi:hypothetical protein